MDLKEAFYHYGDDKYALAYISSDDISLYLTHMTAYRQFRQHAANEMFETIEALYEGHGYRMMHEMESYIDNNDKLTDREKQLLRTFLKGDSNAFEFTSRLVFMDHYDFT